MATTIEADVVVIGAGITSAMFVERLGETTGASIVVVVNAKGEPQRQYPQRHE